MADFPSISVIIPDLKNGDADSWGELVKAFEPGLLGKARGLLKNSGIERHVSPEDLVSTTFLKAWKSCEGGQSDLRAETTRQFAAFILKIIQRVFIDQCRPRNLARSCPSWFAPSAGGQSPSEVMMSEEEEARLHAHLAELPERQRVVMVMRHFDGMKYREIAEALETTPGTIAGLARDGLQNLTRRFRPDAT